MRCWVNYYYNADILAGPLQCCAHNYGGAVTEDVALEAGLEDRILGISPLMCGAGWNPALLTPVSHVMYIIDNAFIERIVKSILEAASNRLITSTASLRPPRLLDLSRLAPVYTAKLGVQSSAQCDIGVLFIHGMANTHNALQQNHLALDRVAAAASNSRSCLFGCLNLAHMIEVPQGSLHQPARYGDLGWRELRNQILSAWPLTMGFYTDGAFRDRVLSSVSRAVDIIQKELSSASQLVVVAADLGGTIATRFFGAPSRTAGAECLSPSHMVTLGCPISWFEDLMHCPLVRHCHWHNLYFTRDVCSTPLAKLLAARTAETLDVVIKDCELEDDSLTLSPWRGWFSALNHSYLEDERTWDVVGSVMQDAHQLVLPSIHSAKGTERNLESKL